MVTVFLTVRPDRKEPFLVMVFENCEINFRQDE